MYEHVINPDKLRARIDEGGMRFGAHSRRVLVDKAHILVQDALNAWTWHNDNTGKIAWTHWSADLERTLSAGSTPWTLQESTPDAREIEKAAQFEAVKRWFEDDWTRIEPKLRTSIVEGVSVFLSLLTTALR